MPDSFALPDVVHHEHYYNLPFYLLAWDSKLDDPHDPQASVWRGFKKFLKWPARGYTKNDDKSQAIYWNFLIDDGIRTHEAMHEGSFGAHFNPLGKEGRGSDGGLNHTPWRELEIMSPTWLRIHDPRGLKAAYSFAVANKMVERHYDDRGPTVLQFVWGRLVGLVLRGGKDSTRP